MCWMAAIPLAISAVGAVQSSNAAGQTAAAQKVSEQQQAQVDVNNATIAGWDASDALAQGAQKAQNSQLTTAQTVSTQRAAMAANGVDITQGSAANITASTQYQGAVDVNTINANAARSAWGYANTQQTDLNNAAMLGYGANQINPAQVSQSTLLTGAGKTAGSAYSAYTAGSFN